MIDEFRTLLENDCGVSSMIDEFRTVEPSPSSSYDVYC